MFIQISRGTIGELRFSTDKKMDTEQAKKYALQKIQSGGYKNCTIGKVYVNGILILKNVNISK